MMKLLPILILLASCGHKHDSEPSQSDWDKVRAQRDVYCSTFDPSTVTRCDRITFTALAAAACGRDYSLAAYEENGKWHRDETHRCFEDGASKTGCSLDGYLSVLHAAHSLQLPIVPRMRAALEENNWLCSSEGPEAVTSIKPLQGIIEHMSGASLDEADASITGFRGHLLASYLYLKRKVYGSNNAVEKAVLDGLYLDNPRSPFYASLSGDFSGAVGSLLNFPTPYSQYWPSSTDPVIYAASVAILEGK